MAQEEYRSCMSTKMGSGRLKGLSKEDRRIEFCSIAKECSRGLAYEEAKRLCAESAANPKPPKEKKGRKICSLRDLEAISVCLVENINLSSLTPDNMGIIFSAALKKCSGAKTEKGRRITSAKQVLEEMDPQHIKALETIAKLSQQAEGRSWGQV